MTFLAQYPSLFPTHLQLGFWHYIFLGPSILAFVIFDYTIAFANDTHIIGPPPMYLLHMNISLTYPCFLIGYLRRIVPEFYHVLPQGEHLAYSLTNLSNLLLSSLIFSTTLRMCFKLSHPSIPGLPQCVCTYPIDLMGIHLLCYAHSNEHKRTHDLVRDTFVAIA